MGWTMMRSHSIMHNTPIRCPDRFVIFDECKYTKTMMMEWGQKKKNRQDCINKIIINTITYTDTGSTCTLKWRIWNLKSYG